MEPKKCIISVTGIIRLIVVKQYESTNSAIYLQFAENENGAISVFFYT